MRGIVIDNVTYMDGHSELGRQKIPVQLVAFPSNLTVSRRSDGNPLFSIPWENFTSADNRVLMKEGLDTVGSILAGAVPIFRYSRAGNPYFEGVWVHFWDEEIQRNQSVFLGTGTERKANDIIRRLYNHRDSYHRAIGKKSSPERR